MRKQSRAFTLIEVLITCLILSVALGMVIPLSYTAYQKMRFARSTAHIESVLRQKKLQALMKEEDLPLTITWEGKMSFNGQPLESLQLFCFSNGTVKPEGTLLLQKGEYEHTLEIP